MFVLGINATAQTCNPDSIKVRSIKAFDTNNSISWELQNHQVYVNPDCPSNHKLLLHLVGTLDNPSSTTYFPILAANHGYKVISLKYPNSVSGTTACRASADFDCHWKYRQEIIFGTDTSVAVSVDSNNCIVNRLEKLLIYLNTLYPLEKWDNYLSDEGAINWTEIAVSGHSQGGGHAAFMAKYFNLDRVIMFASPNEYNSFYNAPAPWISLPGVTPDSNYFGFGNLLDDIVDFEEQYNVWTAMQLNTFGDTIDVDNNLCPYNNSKMLYTRDTSGTGLAAYHNAVVIDDYTPLFNGAPVFTPVWSYMLGLCQTTTSIINSNLEDIEIKAYPNPSDGKVIIESSDLIRRMEVYNYFGGLLKVIEPHQKEAEINMEPYHGLILLKVIVEKNKSEVIKIIVN